MLFRNMMIYFTKMTVSGLYSGRFDALEKTGVYSFFCVTQFFPKFPPFITANSLGVYNKALGFAGSLPLIVLFRKEPSKRHPKL